MKPKTDAKRSRVKPSINDVIEDSFDKNDVATDDYEYGNNLLY